MSTAFGIMWAQNTAEPAYIWSEFWIFVSMCFDTNFTLCPPKTSTFLFFWIALSNIGGF